MNYVKITIINMIFGASAQSSSGPIFIWEPYISISADNYLSYFGALNPEKPAYLDCHIKVDLQSESKQYLINELKLYINTLHDILERVSIKKTHSYQQLYSVCMPVSNATIPFFLRIKGVPTFLEKESVVVNLGDIALFVYQCEYYTKNVIDMFILPTTKELAEICPAITLSRDQISILEGISRFRARSFMANPEVYYCVGLYDISAYELVKGLLRKDTLYPTFV